MAFKVTSTHISKNLTINSNVKDKFQKTKDIHKDGIRLNKNTEKKFCIDLKISGSSEKKLRNCSCNLE
jgi:hypothetical protein